MQVALLGGSFNPPHVGHLLAAAYVRAAFAFDEVWLLPAYRHPFGKPLAPYEHRVAMCRLLCADTSGWLKVSLAEAERDGEGWTIEVLEHLTTHHPDVSFRWIVEDELVTQPSSQTRLILYRIAQEALTNTRKHAQAQLVRVRLRESDDGVAMEVVDDGVGFEPQDAAAPGHLGLATMRERAEMAGGRCELHSLPGQGTSLDVWMPLLEDGPAGSSDRQEDPTAFALFEVDVVDGPMGARSPISR